MKILQLGILIFISTVYTFAQSNSLNGIRPLHSTHSDVERQFRHSNEKYANRSLYKTNTGDIAITYTTEKCEEGWNIPVDSVLSIEFLPPDMYGKSAQELKLERSKFGFSADDAVYGYWTNGEQGIRYIFSRFDKELKSVIYIPKKSDNYLRCNGFPDYSPEGKHWVTLDTFLFYNPYYSKKESLDLVLARSDQLNLWLQNIKKNQSSESYKGYVLVYFDNKLPFKEYKNRLERLKDFFYKKEKAKVEEIEVIEGGMRSESSVELYALPKSWQPPSPMPTLPSPQFIRNKARLKNASFSNFQKRVRFVP
jgi:hypothetical protein